MKSFYFLIFFLSLFTLFLPQNILAADCSLQPENFVVSNQDDLDGDGIVNAKDNCLYIANPDQEDLNNDSIGNACDQDSDGTPNHCDNCPLIANPDQLDENTNGVGDVCENLIKNENETKEKTKKTKNLSLFNKIFKKQPSSNNLKISSLALKKAPKTHRPKAIKTNRIQNDFSEFNDDFMVNDNISF